MSTKNLCFAALTALVTFSANISPVFADTGHEIVPRIVPTSTYRLGFNGAFVGDGMLVQHVHRGSIAERLGLESGDVVVAVNGRHVRSYQHYLNLLDESGGDMTLTVRNVRTGNLVQVVTGYGQDVTGVLVGG